jgi:ABC-type multidrug transport system ATPase subunit
LSIVCGLIVNPKYVLFDEPLIGLDPKAIRVCKQLFEDLKARNVGILVSTHIIETLDDLWDNAVILRNGEIKLQTARDAFATDYPKRTLEEVFFELTT